MENNDYINNNSNTKNNNNINNKINDLNNENKQLKKDLYQNKVIMERLKNEKIKSEKEIEKLKNQLMTKTTTNINSVNSNQKSNRGLSQPETPKNRNYSNKKDYMNSQKEREFKSLNDKIIRLQNVIDNNKKTYTQKINNLNDRLKQKDQEIRKIRNENTSITKTKVINDSSNKNNISSTPVKIKSYSQERKYISTNGNISNSIYKERKETKFIKNVVQIDKISYLNECLQEKEEELKYLKNCLEQKEKELKFYIEKNTSQTKKYKNNIKTTNINNITTNYSKEKELYDQIEIYENHIENKNKEISILKKRIKTLVVYLKRKDNNILILDNELKIVEKQNEEILIDNNALTAENKKLEKINENLLNKKQCTCDIGFERYNTVIQQQKRDGEKLRDRFNGLFNELNEYRKKNVDLSKELKKLEEESSNLYRQNEIFDESCFLTEKTKKAYEENIKKLNDKLKQLKKENEYLKSTLHINNIDMY